jgi:hypothetical protein
MIYCEDQNEIDHYGNYYTQEGKEPHTALIKWNGKH